MASYYLIEKEVSYSMRPILELRGVGKEYRIGGLAPSKSLREQVVGTLKGRRHKKTEDKFWALRNVTFDVYPGESIGIIGRNGAGKSTLLKILSKITPPTKGYIKARGRVASLLEVGTGFHSELTGHENIYLNGSILGLAKAEIDRQYDAIVEFSGVERFLETPLKHYSSGMQLRLAFAVAAHLEPEILVIDEVLAVGDAAFQKKCIGKMDEVSKSGRTILFVSHNMGSVIQLCPRCVLLKQGEVEKIGPSEEIVNYYFESLKGGEIQIEDKSVLKKFELVEVKEGNEGRTFVIDTEIINDTHDNYTLDIILKHQGQKVFYSSMEFFSELTIPPGTHTVRSVIGPVNLLIGIYQFDVVINVPTNRRIAYFSDVMNYSVDYLLMENNSHGKLPASRYGFAAPTQKWELR